MVGGFFPGTSASSTNNTGRHDIAEILLKVALNTINQIIRKWRIGKQGKKITLGQDYLYF